MKKGDKVIYLKEIKMLDYGTVGIVANIFSDFITIIYPQNKSFEDDGKGGFKPIKGSPNKIYAHSARITDIKIVE